jgi:hypothetical protein
VLREATSAPPLARAARRRTTSSACSVSRATVSCVWVASFGRGMLRRCAGSGSLIPARRNGTSGRSKADSTLPWHLTWHCKPVGQLLYLLYRPKLANDLHSRV